MYAAAGCIIWVAGQRQTVCSARVASPLLLLLNSWEGADAHDPGSDWSGDSAFAARVQRLLDAEGAESPAQPRSGWDAWASDGDGNFAGAASTGAGLQFSPL